MRKVLVFVFAVLALSLLAQDKSSQNNGQSNEPATTLRSDVNLVSTYFTVRDNHRQLVSNLPQAYFRVTEDGKPQAIKFFAHHSDVILNVGLMLDTGTNMAWILNREADASQLFMRHVVRPQDLGFILGYAARVETIQLPTSDVAALKASVDEIRHQGNAIGLPNPPAGACLRSMGWTSLRVRWMRSLKSCITNTAWATIRRIAPRMAGSARSRLRPSRTATKSSQERVTTLQSWRRRKSDKDFRQAVVFTQNLSKAAVSTEAIDRAS